MGADRYDVVIVGGGSAGCALANRLSADPSVSRAGARGRSHRPLRPVHPHARRAAVPDRQPALRLEVRDRAGAGDERPPGLPRPRQGARRLVIDQRDDLPARQPDGLRALGRRPGHGGVGLPPLPAVLQADGVADPARRPGRRRRLAWRLRAAEARARPRDQPAVRRVLRGRRSRPATRSPTTSTATARRASRRFDRNVVNGRAAVRRPRLPAPGDGPQEPHRRDLRARHRRCASRASGPSASTTSAPAAGTSYVGAGEVDPVRRRDQHARSCCSSPASATPSTCAPLGVEMVHDLPGRRGEPPGPPRGLHPVRLARSRSRSRRASSGATAR